jgi:hypothetical protein
MQVMDARRDRRATAEEAAATLHGIGEGAERRSAAAGRRVGGGSGKVNR